MILRDTVINRAVRIILECILVCCSFAYVWILTERSASYS